MGYTTLAIEGFEDYRGDYDSAVFIVKPVMLLYEAHNIIHAIEDMCINISLGDELQDDEYLDRKILLNTLYRLRKLKTTKTFKYFMAKVIISWSGEDFIYEIIERDGF